MAPAVSVIVPVYNVEAYLERCLDSILGQSFRDFELILVDDGSTDGSPAICESYRRRDARVRVVRQENAGAGLARNTGLDIARGEYVAFVDADDYLDGGFIEVLHATVVRYDADCVVGGTFLVYAQGKPGARPVAKQPTLWEGDEVGEFLLCTLSAPPESRRDSLYGGVPWGRIYRRQLIEDHCIRFCSEREYLLEDTLFNVDFLRHATRTVAIPGELYYCECGRSGTLSRAYHAHRFEMAVGFMTPLEERLARSFPRERYRLYIQRFLIINTAYAITQEVLYHDHVDPAHPMRANIRRILEDGTLRQYLREYPWHRLPFLRMVLAATMRLRLTGLLILLIRIQQRVMKSCQNI